MDGLSKLGIWLAVGVPIALGMELWSRALHRRLWHGALWSLHASHHAPRSGRVERNDALSVSHAPLAIAALLYGCMGGAGWGREVSFGAGLGMTIFGMAYVVLHDGLVHGRLPVRFLLRWRYFRRVRAAHLVHHARGGEPFGLFAGPRELRGRPPNPGEGGGGRRGVG